MKFIDLFAGVGGVRLGLERANNGPEATQEKRDKKSRSNSPDPDGKPPALRGGEPADGRFECVWSCEIDRWAQAVYRHHWGQVEAGDARRVDPAEIPDHDLLCAGFPCQSFSIAGKRRGFEDTRGTLFYEICRIARAKRPQMLLLENVRGLLSTDDRLAFRVVLESLGELGYDAEWQVLNSKDFGVPQNRERVFIVGHLGGIRGREVFPVGEGSGDNLSGDAEAWGGNDSLSVTAGYRKQHGRGTYIAEEKPMTITQTNPHSSAEERKVRLSRTARSLKAEWSSQQQPLVVIRWQNKWDGAIMDNIAPSLRASGGTDIRKRPAIIDTKKEGEPRIYEIAPTLQGSDYKEPLKVLKNLRIRRLTPREFERLQGFPDDWTRWGVDDKGNKVEISDTQRYKMMGNAVTVNVVEFIARRLRL